MLAPILRWSYLCAGIGILIFILTGVDLNSVLDQLLRFGWQGFSLVLIIYLMAFGVDAASWLLTIERAPFSFRWIWQAFAVRMAGEAYNTLIPAGGIGGEPTKAEILKRRYGINLKEGGASLLIAKTVNMIALVAFLIFGFAMIQSIEVLPRSIKIMAGAGLALLISGTAALFLLQRFKLAGRLARRFARGTSRDWLLRSLNNLDDIEQIFAAFYQYRVCRFILALSLAFVNWLLGIVEIYVVMHFLGHPVDWTVAWIIEAATQMMRTAAFFIPAAIGVQEGTFLFICSLLTGNPTLGISAALIRRAREILWTSAGLIFAATLSSNR